MIKFCNKCKNGKLYFRSPKGIAWKYCDCYKQQLLELKAKAELSSCGLVDLKVTSFDSYVGKDNNKNIDKLRKFVDNFDSKFHNIHLFFYGEQGVQKSTIAKVILYNLAQKGKSILYMNSQEFFNLSMKADFEEPNCLNDFYNADCVVLDEFDTDKISLYKSGYKEKVGIAPLKKRLEVLRKSTIFISNQTIEELKQSQLGDTYGDLVDRETLGCQLVFEDKYCENVKRDFSSIWE